MNFACVFCGSAPGVDPAIAGAAHDLGAGIAARGWGTVYGGASVGLMGAVADAALDAGGVVRGVITPGLVNREVAHGALTELLIEPTLAARKARMFEIADVVLVLPGGYGTLDELFEAITLVQLRELSLPVVLLNLGGFWDPLLATLESLCAAGFVTRANLDLVTVVDSVAAALDLLAPEAELVTRSTNPQRVPRD